MPEVVDYDHQNGERMGHLCYSYYWLCYEIKIFTYSNSISRHSLHLVRRLEQVLVLHYFKPTATSQETFN